MKNLSVIHTGLILGALLVFSQPAMADDLAERITRLEQELAALKKQAAEQAASTPSVSVSPKGLKVESADKAFQMRLGGLMQFDSRTAIDDKNDTSNDQFLARRIRPTMEGRLYDIYSYRIMPDFGNGQSKIYDAYAEAAFAPTATVRIGKFKPPVGIEQFQSDAYGAFPERGLPSSLMPSRDIGAQLSGALLDNRLEYQAGLFNGTTDGGNGDGDVGDGKEVLLRLFATPFATSDIAVLEKLSLGVGGTFGEKSGTRTSTQLSGYKSPVQSTFFSYNAGAYAHGAHKRITPQLSYYTGPFGLLAEYVLSSQEVQLGTVQERLDNHAWGVTATYLLTGEEAGYGAVKPRHKFVPGQGQWGAWELAGRYGVLHIDDNAFPLFASSTSSARTVREVEAGLNWYLNDNVKLMLSYDYSSFTGGAVHGDRADEQTLLTRVQYNF